MRRQGVFASCFCKVQPEDAHARFKAFDLLFPFVQLRLLPGQGLIKLRDGSILKNGQFFQTNQPLFQIVRMRVARRDHALSPVSVPGAGISARARIVSNASASTG